MNTENPCRFARLVAINRRYLLDRHSPGLNGSCCFYIDQGSGLIHSSDLNSETRKLGFPYLATFRDGRVSAAIAIELLTSDGALEAASGFADKLFRHSLAPFYPK